MQFPETSAVIAYARDLAAFLDAMAPGETLAAHVANSYLDKTVRRELGGCLRFRIQDSVQHCVTP